MIVDQLAYLKAPFYNSNCSKPNGSASPFGEAQLDNTKPCSAVTKLCNNGNGLLLSQKRPATLPFGHSNSDALRDSSNQRTPAPSNAGSPVPTTASAKYTEKDFQTMTKFCMDLFL